MEPKYIAQVHTPPDRQAWVRRKVYAAKLRGLEFFRVSFDEDLLLFEAWKERPDDQGEPRWQYETTPSESVIIEK